MLAMQDPNNSATAEKKSDACTVFDQVLFDTILLVERPGHVVSPYTNAINTSVGFFL